MAKTTKIEITGLGKPSLRLEFETMEDLRAWAKEMPPVPTRKKGLPPDDDFEKELKRLAEESRKAKAPEAKPKAAKAKEDRPGYKHYKPNVDDVDTLFGTKQKPKRKKTTAKTKAKPPAR